MITAISVTVHTPPLDNRAGKRRPHRKTSTRTRPQPPQERVALPFFAAEPPRSFRML